MKKNISKILVAVMVFSMMLGVGMVKNAYAARGSSCESCKKALISEGLRPEGLRQVICYKCDCCGKEFHTIDYGNSSESAKATAEAHESTCPYGGSSSSGTSITLENSPLHVEYDVLNKTDGTDYFADETTNIWNSGTITEETRVKVDRASYFTITIPKEIVLNGNDGSASYEVSITGELAGDQVLVVKPDATFTLTEDGGKTTPVTVTQTKDTFNYQNIDDGEKGNGILSASGISAGNWSGKFNFNIEFKAN